MKSATEIKEILNKKMDEEINKRNDWANSARKREERGDGKTAEIYWKLSHEHLDKFFIYKDIYEEITGEEITLITN